FHVRVAPQLAERRRALQRLVQQGVEFAEEINAANVGHIVVVPAKNTVQSGRAQPSDTTTLPSPTSCSSLARVSVRTPDSFKRSEPLCRKLRCAPASSTCDVYVAMADLQPQCPMDCLTLNRAWRSTCPSVVARMPGSSVTHCASVLSTLMAPAACPVDAHSPAASTAARRNTLFAKRASVGRAIAGILDLDDQAGALPTARVCAQQRKNAPFHLDAPLAIAPGGVVQVEPRAHWRAPIAGGGVGGLQAGAARPPIDPERFALARLGAARNRLYPPRRLQVACIAAIVPGHPLLCQIQAVVARRHGPVIRGARRGGSLRSRQPAGGAERSVAGPVQPLAVLDHGMVHAVTSCLCRCRASRRAPRSRASSSSRTSRASPCAGRHRPSQNASPSGCGATSFMPRTSSRLSTGRTSHASSTPI